MITKFDSPNTFEINDKFIIFETLPIYKEIYTISGKNIRSVNSGFSYNSGENQ